MLYMIPEVKSLYNSCLLLENCPHPSSTNTGRLQLGFFSTERGKKVACIGERKNLYWRRGNRLINQVQTSKQRMFPSKLTI